MNNTIKHFDTKQSIASSNRNFNANEAKTALYFLSEIKGIPPWKGKNLVDIGCGLGSSTYEFLSQGFSQVVGVDGSELRLEEFAKKIKSDKKRKVFTAQCNLENEEIAIKTASIDCVISFLTEQYIQNKDHFFKELSRITKPRGIIILDSECHTESAEEAYDNIVVHISSHTFLSQNVPQTYNWELLSVNNAGDRMVWLQKPIGRFNLKRNIYFYRKK